MSDPTLRGELAAHRPLHHRALQRIAGWNPPIAVGAIVMLGLVLHEAAYHLTAGSDYPLTVLANGTRVFEVSHGGLDAMGVGALAMSMSALIETARANRRRR